MEKLKNLSIYINKGENNTENIPIVSNVNDKEHMETQGQIRFL